MSFFSDTAAQVTGSSPNQFNIMSFMPMIVIFILFWFLLMRPQQKKAREHSKMISELQKGDEVISSGGILGKIEKVAEQFIQLEVASNVIISVQRSTVIGKVEKGTYRA